MNVENLFVSSASQSAVTDIVRSCLKEGAPQPDWGLPSSYDAFLKTDAKRKVAVSPAGDGWTALVESKEFSDFGMARRLADELGCTAIILQVSDAIGAFGFLVYENGRVAIWKFDEDASDPLAQGRALLREFGVPHDLVMFREAAMKVREGWALVNRG